MEAASIPLEAQRNGVLAAFRARRRDRRVRRLLSDAERFERAAAEFVAAQPVEQQGRKNSAVALVLDVLLIRGDQ